MLGWPGVAVGQVEGRVVTVQVEQLAGRTLYFGIGRDSGLATGDTLTVENVEGRVLGQLVVKRATTTRSVVTFVGEVFAVTRGQALRLYWAPDVMAAVAPRAKPRRRRRTRSSSLRSSGRVAVDVTQLQSTTRFLVGEGDVSRRFTTSAARFRTTVSGLPHDIRIRFNARASGRFSTPASPVRNSLQLYEASIGNAGSRRPFQFAVGRFFNRFAAYSQYYDGALVRVGGPHLAIGGAAGVEPDRGNERFGTQWRKAEAFVNVEGGGRSGRYGLDLNLQRVWSDSSAPHWVLAAEQSIRAGVFRWTQRARAERQLDDGHWLLTDARSDVQLRVSRAVTLFSRYHRRQGAWRPGLLFIDSTRFEEMGSGLRAAGPNGSWTGEVSRFRGFDGTWTMVFGSSFTVTRIGLGVGLNGSGRYWTVNGSPAYYVSGGLRRRVGQGNVQARYSLYRTGSVNLPLLTHGADVSVRAPLPGGLSMTLRLQSRFGSFLRSVSAYSGVWMTW